LNDPKAPADWLKIDGIDALVELALNLHWSWNHAADNLWEELDKELWAVTQNPWVILQTVSKEKIKAELSAPEFRQRLDSLLSYNRASYSADAWFQNKHPNAALKSIAYFSMEFMLSEALPIYSGGLGNVAGDQLKAASDLGVPVVGIGLLYGQGYFRQDFDSDGRQQALYPVNDPGQLPIRPLRQPNGEWLRLQIQLPEGKVWLRCWEVAVGRAKLYLLDTNDFSNTASHRGITSELYGGDAEMRLKQEIVLGIGGWRLLRVLGLRPEVCHLNEGHAAFATLKRARSYIEDCKQPFDVALNVTRAGNLFTTHTAVSAEFDRFHPDLIRHYLSHYALDELAIPIEDLLAKGRQNARDASEPFKDHYLPAASNYQERAAEDSKQGLAVLHWRKELDRRWNTLAFGAVRVETRDGQHFFQVEVFLGTLNPDQVCVELYANSNDGCKSSIESMMVPEAGADSQGMLTYSALFPATRASSDYTARIIPHHANVYVPLEAGQILWQH
jgi:starch phosphorylase